MGGVKKTSPLPNYMPVSYNVINDMQRFIYILEILSCAIYFLYALSGGGNVYLVLWLVVLVVLWRAVLSLACLCGSGGNVYFDGIFAKLAEAV